MNILHGLTGSVATTIADKFKFSYDRNDICKFILTQSAEKFNPHTTQPYKSQKDVPEYLLFDYFSDIHEWDIYEKDSKVLHIELVKWADVFVIAPCSANTLAKIANGICDNLLTCVARAWNFDKQFIIAPAMNTQMFIHPVTVEHLTKVSSWGIDVIPPVEKTLFCGDTGIGAMARIEDIVKQIKKT